MQRLSSLLVLIAVFSGYVTTGSVKNERDGRYMHPDFPNIENRKLKNSEDEKETHYWQSLGAEHVEDVIRRQLNTNKAKNVIMFLGDGMSIPTITAARMYMGQLKGKSGEEEQLCFEKFPTAGLSKTYCVDKQVADSACTATAYLTGVKGNYGTIGVNGHVPRYDCNRMQNPSHHVYSIAKRFTDKGRSAGILTTTRVTHASPAGAYAHTANRDWESDSDVVKAGHDPLRCNDIAHQLIHGETGKLFKVILGGGRREFRSSNVTDEEGQNGKRLDERDLIEEWISQRYSAGKKFNYVWNKDQLKESVNENAEYLLGLFEADHCKYHLESLNDPMEPTFEDMVEAAITTLSKDDKGFFLFAEGGRIDHAHHDTYARMALDETVEFSKGIAKAVNMTSEEDTLIVVTSDHAHVMSFSGYPSRGHDVLSADDLKVADDDIPFMTLSYANGPGYRAEVNGHRYDVTAENIENPRFQFPAMVPLDSETHGGDDVGVFAHGPWNHLFSGVYEQSFIPHLMAYAADLDEEREN